MSVLIDFELGSDCSVLTCRYHYELELNDISNVGFRLRHNDAFDKTSSTLRKIDTVVTWLLWLVCNGHNVSVY